MRTNYDLVAFDEYGVVEIRDEGLLQVVAAGMAIEAFRGNNTCINGTCDINTPCTTINGSCPTQQVCIQAVCV